VTEIKVRIGTQKAKRLPDQLTGLLPRCDVERAVEAGRLGVELALKPLKRRRSSDQNARYWAILTALADFSGMTKTEVHEAVLCEHFGYDTKRCPFTGMERNAPRQRSSQLNTSDFGDLMALAERWAAEADVVWEEV